MITNEINTYFTFFDMEKTGFEKNMFTPKTKKKVDKIIDATPKPLNTKL